MVASQPRKRKYNADKELNSSIGVGSNSLYNLENIFNFQFNFQSTSVR